MGQFRGQKQNTEGNDRFHRGLGHLHKAQGRGPQGNAMGHGEGSNRLHQPPGAADNQHQTQHKQQVIDAAENVIDAEFEVGFPDLKHSRFSGDHKGAWPRRQQGGLGVPIGPLHPQQYLHSVLRQPRKGNRLTGQTAIATVDRPALDLGAGG